VRSRTGSIASALLAGLLLVGVVAGCGSDDDDSGSSATTSSSGDTTKLTIGYSAWPGWFPLAVADEQGIFEDNGLDVDGEGNGSVTEQRLYQLIRQKQPIMDRTFEIEFLDPGAELFVFTFG